MNNNLNKTKKITKISIFTAIICISSIITIPLPFTTIPITLGLFGILLAALSLPLPDSVISVGAFLLLGFVGLPVFSFFRGGLGVLVSPTGGYIIGYLPCTLLISLFVSISNKKKLKGRAQFAAYILTACLGIIICYSFGVTQFTLLTKTSIWAAILQTIIPFILPDILKAFLAVILSIRLKNIVI